MDYRHNKVAARSLTLDEVKAVANSFEGRHKVRNRAMFVTLEKTGFRISELLSLYVEDVFQAGQVVTVISVPKRNVKGKTESRSIPLHEDARQALLEYLQLSGKTGKLFDVGRRQATQILSDAYQRAGIPDPHGTHACRKTFCQNVYRRLGNDIYMTAILMGHSSVNTTSKYLGYNQQKALRAVLGSD